MTLGPEERTHSYGSHETEEGGDTRVAVRPFEPVLESRDIDDIRGYDRNPRIHSPLQVEAIAASIRDYGFTAPILVDDEGVIVAGHGRLAAAKHLGLKQVPIIELTGLSPEMVAAYRVADNRLVDLGEWDFEALAAEVAALDVNIEIPGFDDYGLGLLRGDGVNLETEPEPADDDKPDDDGDEEEDAEWGEDRSKCWREFPVECPDCSHRWQMQVAAAPDGRRHRALTALRWAGGKAGTRPTCRWIMARLPIHPNQKYVEPFAGMLGVLLARPKAHFELVNDKHERLVQWWTVVREAPVELGRVLEKTPVSRVEYDACLAGLDEAGVGDVERARRWTVAIFQSIMAGDATPHWAIVRRTAQRPWGPLIAALSARLFEVRLECGDASRVVERFVRDDTAMLYLDPPYQSAEHDRLYVESSIDVAEWVEMLRGAEARVAISGYADDGWDELGWRRDDLPVFAAVGTMLSQYAHGGQDRYNPEQAKRVESLWYNYDLPAPPLI